MPNARLRRALYAAPDPLPGIWRRRMPDRASVAGFSRRSDCAPGVEGSKNIL